MEVRSPCSHTLAVLRFGVLGGGYSFVAKDFFFVFGFVCVFPVIRVGGDETFADLCDIGARFNQSDNKGGGRSSRSANVTLTRAIGCNSIGE